MTKSTESEGRGRPVIGKSISIALSEDFLEFIESERALAAKQFGAAPTVQAIVRGLLDRAKSTIEMERFKETK